MKPMIALTNFETIQPALTLSQEDALEFTVKAHQIALQNAGGTANDLERVSLQMNRYGIKPKQISKRAFENIEMPSSGSDIEVRTQFFGVKAREVFSDFYPLSSTPPDHIIHVTCTGYISPSAAQHLVNDNHWAEKTNVTHAYHMGCYAALPAIRMAEGFVAARETQVDIVHTEMCGLHMDRNDHTPEQLVVQSLFADGHVKYSAVPCKQAVRGFKVLKVCEQIVPESQGDMSWAPASWGMKMTLSRDVPKKIASGLRGFVERLTEKSSDDLSQLMSRAQFAIHPGGPKIIDSVQAILELSDLQVHTSREVLFERGNMSSATLPHVWKKLLDQKIPSGSLVVSLAFGPGLTIFGVLFEVI